MSSIFLRFPSFFVEVVVVAARARFVHRMLFWCCCRWCSLRGVFVFVLLPVSFFRVRFSMFFVGVVVAYSRFARSVVAFLVLQGTSECWSWI